MNLRYFIDRPVLSIVISVVIVLMGVISLFSLPVEQYPDIAPPTEGGRRSVGRIHQWSGRHDLYHFYRFQ